MVRRTSSVGLSRLSSANRAMSASISCPRVSSSVRARSSGVGLSAAVTSLNSSAGETWISHPLPSCPKSFAPSTGPRWCRAIASSISALVKESIELEPCLTMSAQRRPALSRTSRQNHLCPRPCAELKEALSTFQDSMTGIRPIRPSLGLAPVGRHHSIVSEMTRPRESRQWTCPALTPCLGPRRTNILLRVGFHSPQGDSRRSRAPPPDEARLDLACCFFTSPARISWIKMIRGFPGRIPLTIDFGATQE